jgi:DNA-binding transcriptional MerR regulator
VTAAGRAPRGGASIGAVLDALRPDFPDVTISKIRFLESEGLVNPGRTPAGYRQFSAADLERLRFVLTAQRDHYLPLKVIKDQLDAVDRGLEPATPLPRLPRSLTVAVAAEPSSGTPLGARTVRVTREELLAESGVDDELLTALLTHGLVRPGEAGFFDLDAVVTARAAGALAEFGVEPRHLRAFRASADREAGLLAQIAGPVARQRDAGAHARSQELVRELSGLSVQLHSALVRTALRDALGG